MPAGLWVAVIIVVPAPIIESVEPLMVAIFRFGDEKVQAPSELEVGAFRTMGASPTVASIGASVPIVGIAPKTRIVILALACCQMLVAA